LKYVINTITTTQIQLNSHVPERILRIIMAYP